MDTRVAQPVADDPGDGGIGVQRLLAAAQDHGVAAFDTQGGRVACDVRPTFENDQHHADRHAHFFNAQTVGPDALFDDLPDGIGLVGDLPDRVGHRSDALVVEGEPVEQRGAESGVAAGVQVFDIFGFQHVGAGQQLVGDGLQSRGALRARHRCQRSSGGDGLVG